MRKPNRRIELKSEKKEILVVFLFIQHQILKAQNERPQKF